MAKFKGHVDRDDTFTGTSGRDVFLFDPANLTSRDKLDGNGGADVLRFTAGGIITQDALKNVVGIAVYELSDAGNSIDLFRGGMVIGGKGNDSISGGGIAYGGSGDDVINADWYANGGTGDDTIYIGEADRRSDGSFTTDVDGGAGNDMIYGAYADPWATYYFEQHIDGGFGADTIEMDDESQNVAIVYDPNDVRVAAAVDTGGFSSTLVITGKATIDLSHRDDQSLNDTAVVTGFDGIDLSRLGLDLSGFYFSNVSVGGGGRDTLSDASLIYGGKGRDTLSSSASVSTLFALAPGDFVAGETITGSGEDAIRVTGSVDFTLGTVTGISGLSIAAGTSAHLHVVMSNAMAAGLTFIRSDATSAGSLPEVSLTLGYGNKLQPTLSVLNVVLNVTGSAADDRVAVGSGTVNVHAGVGNDTVATGGDMYGDAGDDVLTGALDLDRVIDGGDGNDTFVWNGSASGKIEIDLTATDQAGTATTTLLNVENVTLAGSGNASFKVTGTNAANVIVGGSGDDTIGSSAGNDTLHGGVGNDRVFAGSGDDLLEGGLGNDTLTGGTGADTFRWSDAPASSNAYGLDLIMDFDAASDRLEFDPASFQVSGDALDVRVVSGIEDANLSDADLFVFTGGDLENAGDVNDLLSGTTGRQSGEGLFVAGENGSGEVLLYYVVNGDHAGGDTISLIANLGGGIDPSMLDLGNIVLG